MSNRGKLEARIRIPTGGWDLSVVETGGGSATVTVPAGDYYHSSGVDSGDSLVAALAAALTDDATLTATYTVAISAGESGTGKVTITASGGSVTAIALTWDDTDLRDVLGFSGDEVATLTVTGDYHARALWLPDCSPQALNTSPWPGVYESDMAGAESASGHRFAVSGQVKVAREDLRWPAVSQARTWKYSESVTGESFERFWLDNIVGRAAWALPEGPIRYHADADDDAGYWTYKAAGPRAFAPDQVKQNWAGKFLVHLPRLVLLPAEVDKDPAGDPPVAAVNVSVEGTVATFTDASTDSDGEIVSWSLDPGDGSAALTGPGPWVHDYGAVDTFTWTLTVTDSSGLVDEATDDVTTEANPFPETDAEWAANFPAIAAPIAIHPCRDASLPLVDTVGSADLLAGASPPTLGGESTDPLGRASVNFAQLNTVEAATSGVLDFGAGDWSVWCRVASEASSGPDAVWHKGVALVRLEHFSGLWRAVLTVGGVTDAATETGDVDADWHDVIVTRSVADGGEMCLYVDGVKFSVAGGVTDADLSNGSKFTFGGDGNAFELSYHARFDYALSDADVAAILAARSP